MSCDERKDLILRQFSTDGSVHREVAKIVAGRTRSEWRRLCDEHDIPAEPVRSLSEALDHPQVHERELLRPGPEELPRLGFPALVDGVRPRAGEAFPQLGEHTERLVEELDLAPGLSRRKRRRAGIGRRFSVKRWLLGFAGRILARNRST